MKTKYRKQKRRGTRRVTRGGSRPISKLNFSRLRQFYQGHPPFNEEVIRGYANNIDPTFRDPDTKQTLLDILLSRSRTYFNPELIRETIQRMVDAGSTRLITVTTIGGAIHGFVPYRENHAEKKQILEMLFNYAKGDPEMRFDGFELRELLQKARFTNNYTVLEELYKRGYDIHDKVMPPERFLRFNNEPEEDFETRSKMHRNYVESYKRAKPLHTAAHTLYSINKATGHQLPPDNVDELLEYLE
jgi:hypothetical protein